MPNAKESLELGIRAERSGALDRALDAYREAAESDDPDTRAEALTRQADVHREQCEWDRGIEVAQAAQAVAERAGLQQRVVEAIVAEANILMSRGDFVRAMPRFRDIVESSADSRLRGIALQNIASMLAQLGQYGAAERSFRESLGHFQKAGYDRGQAIAWNNLGRLALDQKDASGALPHLHRALQGAKALGDLELEAIANQNLALAEFHLGNLERADDLVTQAVGYFAQCNNQWRQIECLRLLGGINEQRDHLQDARRCYERALRLAEQIDSEVEIRVTRHKLDTLRRS